MFFSEILFSILHALKSDNCRRYNLLEDALGIFGRPSVTSSASQMPLKSILDEFPAHKKNTLYFVLVVLFVFIFICKFSFNFYYNFNIFIFISSDRSSYSDSVLLLVRQVTFSDFEHFCQYI